MLLKRKPLAVMVLHGTEITKPMPPGHFNAVFIRGCQPNLLIPIKVRKPLNFINGLQKPITREHLCFGIIQCGKLTEVME